MAPIGGKLAAKGGGFLIKMLGKGDRFLFRTVARNGDDISSRVSKRLDANLRRPGDQRTKALKEARVDGPGYAKRRAEELQRGLRGRSQEKVTMATGVGRDSAGRTRVVVGTSEDGGYLRPGVRLRAGEELATGSRHAERNVLQYMKDNGIKGEWIGAGRGICDAPVQGAPNGCAGSIRDAWVRPVTPYKNPDRWGNVSTWLPSRWGR